MKSSTSEPKPFRPKAKFPAEPGGKKQPFSTDSDTKRFMYLTQGIRFGLIFVRMLTTAHRVSSNSTQTWRQQQFEVGGGGGEREKTVREPESRGVPSQ